MCLKPVMSVMSAQSSTHSCRRTRFANTTSPGRGETGVPRSGASSSPAGDPVSYDEVGDGRAVMGGGSHEPIKAPHEKHSEQKESRVSGRDAERSGQLVVMRRAVVGGLALAGSGGLAMGSGTPGVDGAPRRALTCTSAMARSPSPPWPRSCCS